jgi:hypothetical protein
VRRTRIAVLASVAGLILLWLHLVSPLLACVGDCFPDYPGLRENAVSRVETADARLNSWILGWVHHALTTSASLFDANIFHPVRNTLAASEHLLGIAVPLLPLSWLGAGPVALHQTALTASFLLTALTTFALARWLTGSIAAGFVAGAVALFMPWRIAELSHVQLLSAQWFPLVWLMIGRIVYRDRPRAAAGWLAALATLQVLTSFYLAYFLMLSCAVLVLVLLLREGASRRTLLQLGAGAAAPGVALAVAALPYLAWRRASGFEPVATIFDSVPLSDAWALLGPSLATGLGVGLPRPISYHVPWAVALLALLALLPAGSDARRARRRGFTVALWTLVPIAFVLALGRELQVGGSTFALPSQWLAWIVPGFDLTRNPLRWALLIGLALPVLAATGLWQLERRAGSRALWAVRAGALVALGVSLPSSPIPARPAWEDPESVSRVYGAVAALPDGPVVEVPWPAAITRNVELSTRYMLASTLHWKPITNGSSGYYPRPYALLSELGTRLPDPVALAQLQRLTGARWVVVHGERMPPEQRNRWARAARQGRLRPVLRGQLKRVYELPDGPENGRYMEALRSRRKRPQTFAGLSRAPLELAGPAGSLQAGPVPTFYYRAQNRMPTSVPVQITNTSDVAWPAFDTDPEGLVRLRYTFREPGGSTVLTESAPLIVDIAPGASVDTTAVLRPPAQGGRYTLRLELVQSLAGGLRALPVPAAELEVDVVEAAPPMPGA